MTALAHTSSSFGKRIFFWCILLLGGLTLFFVLIVLIVPRAINRDAIRSWIEATISKELGGTVTYDRAKLALIPRPKIEFQNLKIAVPLAASASAAEVKIYARLFPLLHGRFEVSSITLDKPALALMLPEKGRMSSKRAKQKKTATSPTVSSVLATTGRAMPDLSLKILQGSISLVRDGQTVLSVANLEAMLAFAPESLEGQEHSERTSDDHYHITGKLQAVLNEAAALPGPLRISIVRFDAYPKNIVIVKSRARLLDMDMTLAGSIDDYLSEAPRSNIVFGGSIGQNASYWIRTLAGLPEEMTVRTPIKVRDVRLRSSGTGASSLLSLAGRITVRDDTAISFSLWHKPDLLEIESLQVKDSESDAILRLTSRKKDLDLAFRGILMGDTLSRILDREHMPFRKIAGDMSMHLPRDRWNEVTAEGTLEGEGLIIPSPFMASITVDRFSTRYHGSAVDLRPVVLSLGQDILTVEGNAAMSETGVALDLDVSANRIDTAPLLELAKKKKKESNSVKTPSSGKKLKIEGDIRLRTAVVTLPSYTVNDVAMTVSITGGQITADLERASLCGINLDGTLKANDHEMEISLEPRVHGGKLDEGFRCILHEDLGITGNYDLSGRLAGHGSSDTLLRSLQGNLDFISRKGHIQNDKIVKGVIAYLNSTSLLKGSRSSLLKEGVPYETFTLRGSVRDGVVSLSEAVIRSKDLHITADGDIDLRKDTLALNILAAPFTSMDQLLSKIPIVKYLAGSALIVVPVRVEGTFHEPQVRPLPVSGVSTNVTNLMKNIVQAPVKVIEPVIPRELDKGSDPEKDRP